MGYWDGCAREKQEKDKRQKANFIKGIKTEGIKTGIIKRVREKG